MEKYDIKFKKKYGQNFLRDNHIINRIIDIASIKSQSLVIEVGPGTGVMTKELAKIADHVIAYEIDYDLAEELSKSLNNIDNVDIIYQNFLDVDLFYDLSNYSFRNLYFVSNVPYYITTPILFKLINSNFTFNKIVMMVQKEVGERFTTKEGNREYGAITVLLNYLYKTRCELYVSRDKFYPVPKVDSVVVSFENRINKPYLKDYSFFENFVKEAFQFKRKTIKNNLKGYDLNIIEKILKDNGFDLNSRAEELPIQVFVDLANELMK